LGHQQAQETGKFLDSWLTEKRFSVDDITWMSSPFLRCLQTSDDALNSFRKVNVHTLPILPEYSIFEWDGQGGQWHQDLPSLEERKHYFPRLDVNYESAFIPTLPGT
jgi:broad specificity phosphatase PhoE